MTENVVLLSQYKGEEYSIIMKKKRHN